MSSAFVYLLCTKLTHAVIMIEHTGHGEDGMSDETMSRIEALGRDLTSLPQWRWIEGMKTLPVLRDGTRLGRRNDDSITYRVCARYQWGGARDGVVLVQESGPRLRGLSPALVNLMPDMRDAGTRGCVLALVREVTGDDGLRVRWRGCDDAFLFDGGDEIGSLVEAMRRACMSRGK